MAEYNQGVRVQKNPPKSIKVGKLGGAAPAKPKKASKKKGKK